MSLGDTVQQHGCPRCKDPVAWTRCWACGWRLHGQETGAEGVATSEGVEPSVPVLAFSLAWAALASSNERHRAGGGKARAHSKKYRESRDAIRLTATAHLRQRAVPLPAFPSGNLAIRMRFFPPNRRRRDESNYFKALADALNGIVYSDDSQITDWHGTREKPDPRRPRVEIEVRAA